MSKIIAITGTPGAGKSTLAIRLSKELNLPRLDLHHHYKEISTTYNRRKQCYDIDLHKFEKLIKEKLKQHKSSIILDSHVAHLLSRKLISLCIVMTCSDLKKLQKRLEKRKYSKKKIRENLDAEIFQICLTETQEKKLPYLIIDNSTKIDYTSLLQKIRYVFS